MFGCHKCQHCGKIFSSYEISPCATCVTEKDPKPISHYESDPASFSSLSVMHPAYEEQEDDKLERTLTALGQCVRGLVHMKESHPDTYKFVIAKMDKPALSYSEIAAMFSCRKQNVLYHFRKAVRLIPELSHAIIIDKRFLGGRPSALKVRLGIAPKRKADVPEHRQH
jgi:hypothetical protein